MAEIEIVYRKGYCEYEYIGANYYCERCLSEYARDTDCPMVDDGKRADRVINGKYVVHIPFGDCIHAKIKYIHRGMSVKNYELEEDPEKNCMILTTKKCVYECVKVVLNGKVVFNKYDEGVEPQESEEV